MGQLYLNIYAWLAIGVTVVIIGFWYFKNSSEREIKELKNEWDERIEKLIKEGNKITVDLSKCEIRSSSQQTEKKDLDYLDETEAIDIILNSGENLKQRTIAHSTLVYKHESDNGQIFKFYGSTNKDKSTLELLCAMQKTTTLYFYRNDPEVYYFDLKFLG